MSSPDQCSVARCDQCGALLSSQAKAGRCLRCALSNALEPCAVAGSLSTPSVAGDQPAALADPLPRPFGDYELFEEIGRGGMGVVHKARQISLDRIVAIKLLPFSATTNPEYVKRFRGEASAAASLQHPNVVAIHEVGVYRGQHYFAMDLVEGPSLARMVAAGPLPARDAVRYVKTVAEAIEYAHRRGILHRDLKPSNVLLDQFDQPRVTDFGLAKRLEGDGSLTLSGQMVGSPSYMPPEQCDRKRGKVGRRSDVYALGAMLYHLVAGRAPFVAGSIAETLWQVQNDEPVAPAWVNPSVPRDLTTICLKCLEKEPAKRYPTAKALVDELGRFLNNQPIQARPVGFVGKTWRWFRRRPAVAGLVVALVVTFGTGFTGVLWQWRRAERHAANEAMQRLRSDQERHRAEAGELAARQILYASDMNLALEALEADHLGRACELLNRHQPGRESGISESSADLRGWEWRHVWALCQGDELWTLISQSNDIPALAFSPDGKRLATGDDRGVLRICSIDTRQELHRFALPARIQCVQFSPHGAGFATAGGDGLRLWRSADPARFQMLLQTQLVVACAFAPDGTKLAALWHDQVGVWHAGDGREAKRFVPVPSQWPKAVAFSTDSGTLALGMMDGPIILWDLHTDAARLQWPAHQYLRGGRSAVSAVAFSPNGKTLASAGWDKTVKLWDVATGHLLTNLTRHNGWVSSVAFSPDGRFLASAGADQTVRLWDTTSWEELARLRGHLELVGVVRWSPDGQLLATGARDGTVKLWDPHSRRQRRDSLAIPQGGDFIALSPDGRWLFAQQANRSFFLLDTEQLELPSNRQIPVRPFTYAGVGPAGTMLCFGTATGQVNLYRVEGTNLTPAGTLVGHRGRVLRDLSFSPDGKRLATVGEDMAVRVWDVAGRIELARFSIPSTEPTRFSFSGDGQVLALACWDTSPTVWDLRTRREVAQFRGHPASVPAVWLSANGETAVTACRDGAIRFWEVKSQQQVLLLRGDSSGLSSVAVSPDGQRVAAGTLEGTVEVWDLNSRQEVATFRGHKEHVFWVAFTPDGNTLVSASADSVFARRAPALPAHVGELSPLSRFMAGERVRMEHPSQ